MRQLRGKMKTTDALTDILQLAKTVESVVQTETLSKQLLQNAGKLGMTTKLYAIQKITTVKTNVSNQIWEVPVVGNHPARIKVERNVGTGHSFPPKQCPAYCKEFSNARRRIISENFVRIHIRSQVMGVATLNILQRKMFMKWRTQGLNMKLILWNLNGSSF